MYRQQNQYYEQRLISTTDAMKQLVLTVHKSCKFSYYGRDHLSETIELTYFVTNNCIGFLYFASII